MRPKARALAIVERLKEQIEDHASEHPDLWSQIPVAVFTEPKASMDALGHPYVSIEVDGVEAGDGGSIELNLDRLNLTLYLETEDPENPQRALLEFVADVRRAVVGNRQLADADGVPFIECGQIFDRGYTAVTDFMEGSVGRGLAEYRVDIEYQWTPETA
jgi:hypothetical protein